MKKKSIKNICNIILLVGLTCFALWFALKDDYQSVIDNIKSIPLTWVLIISTTGIIYYCLQGVILTMISRTFKKDIRWIDGIHNAFTAAFFNGVTPLGGGQVSQTYVMKKQGIKFSDIASILWIDFIIFQSVVIGYVTLLFILYHDYIAASFSYFTLLIVVGYLINAFVIVSLWTMSKFPHFYEWISGKVVHLLVKIHVIKHEEIALEKWNNQLKGFTHEIQNIKNHKPLIIKALLLNILRMTLFYAVPYLVALSLGYAFDVNTLMHVLVLSACVHMLNALTPLPGDTGWTESAFIIMFSSVFTHTNAASIMILWRVATYHIILPIGGSIFLYIKSSKRYRQPDSKALKKELIEANC